ncbi:MAG: response regulator [Dysgonamonadaceae bacterium]|jgi:signal transduction histidine kinase/ligand-binding sensor domain-containing protein/DNA-binding response OmpR family regulator|nr:response regulator [Dysgonamonadaceae bacterium]
MKRMIRLFTFFYIFFILAGSIETRGNANYYFSGISGESGLSQVSVKAIIQDSYGFIWFGTRNRLNRYDGIAMKVFDCYDLVLKKRNNNISTLFESGDRKMWVGTDKGIYIFDPVYETFSFFNETAPGQIQITDWVADIRQDMDNNIWIVIPNQGLFRYHTLNRRLTHYAIGGSICLPDQGNPECICIEPNGMVWIGTNGGGVYLYHKETDSFAQYLGDKNGSSLKNENIYTMCDYGEELILGIHEGRLRKLNKRKNTLTDVNAPEVHYKIIRKVTAINDDLWVGTQAGLFIVNEKENKVVHIQNDPMISYSLSDNVVESIYKDRENGVWIGTALGGVNYLSKKGIDFEWYIPTSSNLSIGSRRIRELAEDAGGNIWIASEDAGLNIFNPHKKEFKRIGPEEGLSLHNNKLVLGMLIDRNQAWIGLFKNGLDIIQLPQFNVRHYSGTDLKFDEASIYTICEDRYGQIWIGNGWNVYRGNRETLAFERMDEFGLNYIYDIMEDSNGLIWVATMGNGVYKYNPSTRQIKHYTASENDTLSLSSNSVSDITETSTGDIWFSTDRGGICRYNRNNDNFTSFSIADGLPDDVAYKIIEDKEHNLWFGTNNGLVKFNPKDKSVKVFSNNNGLPVKEFYYKAALVSSSGKFYFGGLNGLIAFDPYHFEENHFIPPVYITQLTIFNREVDRHTPDTPLEKAIAHTRKITLRHNQSNIGFEFVALSYTAPQSNRYAYKMEGVDEDWTYTSNMHSASYAKLPPGKYVFRVKGSNNDHLWNDREALLEIEILPPWWLSKIALAAGFLLSAGFLYYLFDRYRKNTERKRMEKQKLFESEKEKELYRSKVEFFTNIAHDIRTPVTLINGPLESMLEMDVRDPEILKNLTLMSKNTSDLLNLVNQLLDFRKVDSNKFILNRTMNNATEILRTVYAQFEPLARRGNKSMHLSLPPEDIFASLDKSAFLKILNNLFSNALRYSDQEIDVAMFVENDCFCIRIRNDGALVPEDLREKIFAPFYQVNRYRNNSSSSGIGLSLARSLSELHQGQVYFEEYREQNGFVLKLPVQQEETEEETKLPENDYILEESDCNNEKTGTEVILVVEDNDEMLSFIVKQMQKRFVVEKAADGEEAMKILEEKNIDLVLTDVMMPGIDGFELCRNIKTNLNYSHIPVVLLTAKNDLQSKIHGLEMGADAYVEKPFSISHLIAQLNTLFHNRRREKEAFLRKPFLPIQNIGMNKADEQLIQKIIDVIQENITDPEFSVERLSEAVFMSRSSLHRKTKALTDLTPSDFVRLVRLRKAAELIRRGDHRIGEVCYLVGINSSSYFIKLFQKQFGMTPKEFVRQQQKPD